MIDVVLSGPPEEVGELEALGNKVQSRFRFVSNAQPDAVRVELKPELEEGALSVSRGRGVQVSLAQSDGISLYAGLPRPLYLLCSVVLGLVYWRVLKLNSLLVWEDLLVRQDPGCLCAARIKMQDFALAFEQPHVCPACLEFFRCTGAETETTVLQHVLALAAAEQAKTCADPAK